MTGFHPSPEFPTEYGLSRRERAENLECQRHHRVHWVVTMRHGNRSAFNGYRWTPSDYSELICTYCGRRWRTRANYVKHFPDAKRS
jgi:hypothetical protein